MSQFQPPQPNTDYPHWQQPQPDYAQPQAYQQEWQQPPYPPPPETYYPPSQPLTPTPQPPRKRVRRNNIALAIIVSLVGAALLIVFSIAIASGASSTPQLSPAYQQATATANAAQSTNVAIGETAITNDLTQQAASTPTPVVTDVPVTPAPTFASFTDGTYQVGTDIQPGTYRTRTGSPGCYYERLKGFSGTLGDILANNNTDNPAIVTILPTDKGFNSQNCGTWTKDLSQITTSKTSFDDGMYIVGTDIKPGTYKSSGSQGCYYARLSGFTGTLYSILANNNTDNVAIVTIYASDKGFESTRCGTWTRI